MARQVQEWTGRQFVINRYNVWFSEDAPKTISCKEICENAIDQASDRKATMVDITIGKNFVQAIDNGGGISLSKGKNGNTHMYTAMAKLFSSSNYAGSGDTTGNFGVGGSATNFLSRTFMCGNVNDGTFKGYLFREGLHKLEGKKYNVIENFEIPFDKGFYVCAVYDESILEDDIDRDWVRQLIEDRTGELPENCVVTVRYAEPYDGETGYDFVNKYTFERDKEGNIIQDINETDDITYIHDHICVPICNGTLVDSVDYEKFVYDKIHGSEHYVKSWSEKLDELEQTSNIVRIKKSGWEYAFSTNINDFANMKHMVQCAPVQNTKFFKFKFEIEDAVVPCTIPFISRYNGKVAPKYQDQTKRKIKFVTKTLEFMFKKYGGSVYKHFLKEAELAYIKHNTKTVETEFYWPAIGNGYKELIITEGFSPADGCKSMRDSETQAVLALQGAIMNTYGKSINGAMKSPIVKELLSVLRDENFDRILVFTDADTDGAHIFLLVLGFLFKFTNLVEEGKVFYGKTPKFVFNKGKEFIGSDNEDECPRGWTKTVKKGLGGLTKNEVHRFITNPDTRTLYRVNVDEYAEQALDYALLEGGKDWIVGCDD
mgnify:CR=1 FL=1